jgi:glutathione S-transferase
MSLPSLWQFKSSHFSEKVRWTLDWKEIPHERLSLLPGWHAIPTRVLTKQNEVPILVIDGEVFTDSTTIIEHLEKVHPEQPLYPSNPKLRTRAVELEDYFDDIGDALRRVHYSLFTPYVDEFAAFFGSTTTGAEFNAWKLTWSAGFLPGMGEYMDFSEDRVAQSRADVEEILQRFEEEIRPSGFILGDSFGVVDLTLASLLSTFIFPTEFPYPLAMRFPEPVEEYRSSLEHYAALDWAREIYAKHRAASAEVF